MPVDETQAALMDSMLEKMETASTEEMEALPDEQEGEEEKQEEDKQPEETKDEAALLREKVLAEAEAALAPTEEKKEPEAEAKTEEPLFEEITEDEFDSMLRSSDGHVKFNEIRKRDMKRAVEHALKGFLLTLPEVLPFQVSEVMDQVTASKKFYEDNPDLAAYRPVVVRAVNAVRREKPEASLNDILNAVEAKVREELKMPKGAKGEKIEGKKDAGKRIPFNPRGNSGAASAPRQSLPRADVNSLDAQFNRMLKEA